MTTHNKCDLYHLSFSTFAEYLSRVNYINLCKLLIRFSFCFHFKLGSVLCINPHKVGLCLYSTLKNTNKMCLHVWFCPHKNTFYSQTICHILSSSCVGTGGEKKSNFLIRFNYLILRWQFTSKVCMIFRFTKVKKMENVA